MPLSEYARFQPMTAQLGLGMAALGRPGYVTLDHAAALGGDYDPAAMESHAHEVLDAAYDANVRYYDMARSYGKAEEFFGSWVRKRGLTPREIKAASKWGYTYTAGWSTHAEQHEVKDHSLATFQRQFAETMARVGEYLSLYQIHSVTADSTTLNDDALIDAIARVKRVGIKMGFSTSGPGQAAAIRTSLGIKRGGIRVFDWVQSTWNLFERGAESALEEARAAGMRVVIKEALANGRLTHGNPNDDPLFAPYIPKLRAIAERRGTTIEMIAMAAALARPWATIVLSGAATVGQIQASARARDFDFNDELEDELRGFALSSSDYWRARSGFSWN
jgi:aryl-alcohol dehydrogenase-like predicted oxidoreductase